MQEKRDAEMEGCSKGGIPPDCKDLGQSKEILGICLFYQTNSPRTLFKVLISLRYRCPYRVRADCWGGGGAFFVGINTIWGPGWARVNLAF